MDAGQLHLKTSLLKVDPLAPQPSLIARAARLIRLGEVVAFPTETVYGLGADATNDLAVEKIFEAKGRPSDNPIIVHISSVGELAKVVRNPSPKVVEFVSYYWPGPLTVIFKKSSSISYRVTAGLETVAVRMPAHPVALALISASGRPIAAPSANISGRPSPTSAQHVVEDLDGRIPLVLDGGETRYGVESTVIDISGETPVLLRPGPITTADLSPLLGEFGEPGRAHRERPIAPGMKYVHYAPNAPLTLVLGKPNGIVDKVLDLTKGSGYRENKIGVLCTDETYSRYPSDLVRLSLGSRFAPYEMLRNLYRCLRFFDKAKVSAIYAEGFDEIGINATLMNRLRKAATNVVET